MSEAFSTTREDPTLRRERGPLYAFTMQGLYATGVAAVGFGIARAMLSEFIALASRKAPRGLARLADNAVVQADVARAEARLGSARAYLIETLTTIYAHADDVAPIEVADRARVRLACTNAIQGAAEVADFAYKAAGVDAIFPGSPFERRFRDMHTLSQQIQARGAHFESVGQILLGVPPEVFLLRSGECQPGRRSMIPGIAFRALQRDTAVDHQHLAGDIAGIIAEQKFHGVADVPAGTFRLQHRGVGALGARSLAHAVAAGVDHRRVHRTRADAVDPDVVAAVIDRHRLGQSDHRGL